MIYPNTVPENNLRLPDALTIEHGPARLLAKFVIEGDKAARQIGPPLATSARFRRVGAVEPAGNRPRKLVSSRQHV